MAYILLLIGVITFLSFVAWRFPHRPLLLAAGTGEAAQSGDEVTDRVARALKGDWTEERPCLTPIDCVLDHHCDGHCGRH